MKNTVLEKQNAVCVKYFSVLGMTEGGGGDRQKLKGQGGEGRGGPCANHNGSTI